MSPAVLSSGSCFLCHAFHTTGAGGAIDVLKSSLHLTDIWGPFSQRTLLKILSIEAQSIRHHLLALPAVLYSLLRPSAGP